MKIFRILSMLALAVILWAFFGWLWESTYPP